MRLEEGGTPKERGESWRPEQKRRQGLVKVRSQSVATSVTVRAFPQPECSAPCACKTSSYSQGSAQRFLLPRSHVLRAPPLPSHRLLFAPLYVQVSQGGGSLALCTCPAPLASASPTPPHKTYLPTFLSSPQLRSTDQNVSPVSLCTRRCPLLARW